MRDFVAHDMDMQLRVRMGFFYFGGRGVGGVRGEN